MILGILDIPNRVELPHAEYVHLELADVVDAGEGEVFPILVAEDDRASTLNAHHRAITEPHGPVDPGVENDERRVCARHVVGGARVDHPPRGVDNTTLFSDVGKDTLLHQVDRVSWRDRRRQRCNGSTSFEISEWGTRSSSLDSTSRSPASSSSTTWAWPIFFTLDLHSLAQWPSLPHAR
jgi:hypothetical protein